MTFKIKIAFSFLLLLGYKAACQNSLIATWKFNKIGTKDSTILSVDQRDNLRNFIIRNKKINFSIIPPHLIDTFNKRIDKELILVETSFLKLKNDSTFEISRNEILIPVAIPGIATDSIISGTWRHDSYKQILTFQTASGLHFQYKIISVGDDRLLTGIIYNENQQPKFITTFIRD